MTKIKQIISLALSVVILALGTSACTDEKNIDLPTPPDFLDPGLGDEDDGVVAEPTTKAKIKVLFNEENKFQQVDGFGCSVSGNWCAYLFAHVKREELLDKLFTKNGLDLQFCRTDFNETYENSGSINFEWDKPFNSIPADHPSIIGDNFDDEDIYHGIQRTGQKWAMSYLRKKAPDVQFMYSAWSPPAMWKTSGKPNNGYLKPEHFADYATYLVDYFEGIYRVTGAYPAAISPWNEPNSSSASWPACGWKDQDMADFVVDYLRPELNKRGHQNVAIIVGEHAWWESGRKFVDRVLDARPEIVDMNIVIAGHGYFTGITTPKPYEKAMKAGLKVWNTETSDTSNFDPSWKDGLMNARRFHYYLAQANLNVFYWWQGSRPGGNNEALINCGTNWRAPFIDVVIPMRYYTFGHFSKYIPIGSNRYATELKVEGEDPEMQAFLDKLLISAYVDDVKNEYAIVIINDNDTKSQEVVFDIENLAIKNMQKYESIEDYQWKKVKINPSAETSSRYTTILPYSVTTLKGKLVTNNEIKE